MRDRQHLAAGRLFVSIHIVPQHVGCGTDQRGIRQHLVRLVLAVAQDDDAVKIVAFGGQRIFKAHEGGKLARFVIALDY